jgi:hypothetical protein
MFTFLSPLFQIGPISVSWLLVGGLAAVIPLIIHLSRSRRTKKMRFSTTRFFTDQFLRSYRMSRLKELLLLALRMALCALLALALARPLYKPPGQVPRASGSRAVVLVIDNSASMGYTENGATLLDRARYAARAVIGELRANDTASVVLAARRADGPEVLFPQPTPELGDVSQAIDALQVAALGTDLSGAVQKAEEILAKTEASSKEIYVLSDLQVSGWEKPDADTAPPSSAELQYYVVRVAPQKVNNLAVTRVEYTFHRPMLGVPFKIRPRIYCQGDDVPPSEVRLYIDGQKVGEKQLGRLQNGRAARPTFVHAFASGGWHSGYVEVQDDNFTVDNRRYFAFEVLDSVNVLAINGPASKVRSQDELLYLKAALAGDPESKKGPVVLETKTPAELAGISLDKYRIVILANVETFADAAVEKLEAFVDRGGSLLIFLGDRVQAGFYNDKLAGPTRLQGGLLPGRLLKVEGNPAGTDDIATIKTVDFNSKPLEAFEEARVDWGRVTFKALWGMDPGQSAVLMHASNGLPLLCEKPSGKGRVLLFASTCDRAWTNFPTRPAYLLWLYQLVSYLAQDPLVPRTFPTTGEPVPVPIAATEGLPQVVVDKPDKTRGHVTTRSDDPANAVEFNDTFQPGIYTFRLLKKEGAPNPVREENAANAGRPDNAPQIAVNLENYESDLTYLDDQLAGQGDGDEQIPREAHIEAGLKAYLPGRQFITYVPDPRRINEVSLTATAGWKLWDYLLFVVLAFALFEPLLANRISVRHYARPRELSETAGRRTGRWGGVVAQPGSAAQTKEAATP